jgi:two-component system sensor histidine kinase KdpD
MNQTTARAALEIVATVTAPAAVSAVAGLLLGPDVLADVAMLYLLGVVVVSLRFGFRAAIASAVLSVLCFDFFFILPYLTLTVADVRHVITFGVMLLVAFVIAGLARRVRNEEATRLEVETERLRNTLLSSISHDLRTPLAVMKGAASTLVDREDLDPEVRRELLHSLLEESERLERLVGNVLDMTRLQAGGVKLRRELQSVEELVGGALNRLEPVLKGRPVSALVPSSLYVTCDAALVEQLLVNLLENAVKHTPEATAIEVGASAAARELLIHVRDRGKGLGPDELETAFEKFNRGRQRRGSGVGLGLAICRATAEAHGGRVVAANHAEGGAVFTLILPWEPSAALSELGEASGDLAP